MPSNDDPRLQETLAGPSSSPHVGPSESDDETVAPAEVVPAAPADQLDSQDTVAAETLVLSYADTAASAGQPAAPQATNLRRFGDYELIGELARGGMGVVYKARQVSLNRTVALKMILAGQLADDAAVQRFHIEAEAAAKLDHPGIVPIYEVGQHEGQHYFSMGFVEGQSLANKLADGPLPPEEAVELVKKLAEAMAYAHEHGVIHRDLKPANVLLDQHDQPRIADFGLAKELAADSNLTGTGQILGTPSYMPPEQAAGKTDQIGPVADVYALGAVLYALLTGRPPFQAANTMDTLLQVLNKEPVSPRELNEKLPRDLETICLKCLEKEPHQRYAAAAELAGELGCYLRGEPISARPISRPARAWRWCRRKPVLASLVATIAVVSISAFCLVTWQWREAVAARADAWLNFQSAERKRVEADRLASEKQVLLQTARNKQLEAERRERTATAARLAIQAEEIGDENPVRRLLLATEAADVNLRHGEPVLPAAHGILRFALSRVGGQPLAAGVRLMKTSPSKRWLFIATDDGAFGRWDLEAEAPATTECLIEGHDAPVSMIDVSSDERWLVTGGEDRRVRLWNLATTPPTSTVLLDDHTLPLMNVGLTSDGRWVVASSSMSPWGIGESSLGLHEIRLWRLDTRDASSSPVILAEASLNVPLNADHGWCTSLRGDYLPRHRESFAISADGRWMVTGTPLRDESKADEGTIYWTRVTLWDLRSNDVAASGRALYSQQDRFDGVVGFEFSPDSRWLLTIVGAEARLWDLTAEAQTFAAHHRLTLDRSLEGSVDSSHNIFAKFLPDGQRLVMKSGPDVQLWDLRGEQPNFTTLTNDAEGGVHLSGDGNYVVTAGQELQKWVLGDSAAVATTEVLAKPAEPVEPSEVRSGTNARIAGGFRIRARSPDGSRIATDHTGAALAGIPKPPRGVNATSLFVWDLATERALPVYYGPNVPADGPGISQVAFLSSQRIVAWASGSNLVYFGDVHGKLFRLRHFQGHEWPGAQFWATSSNERWLITADRIARLWDLQDQSPLLAHHFPGSCAGISLGPDDRRVATIGTRGIQSIWSIEKDQPLGTATELSALKFVSDELRQNSIASLRQRLDLDGNGHVDREELLANRRNARSTRRAATKPVSRLPRSELTYESSSYGRGDVRSSSYPRIILHRDWLAAGAVRGKLLVWDLRNPDPAAEAVLLDHAGPISSVSASDDGHWLVTFGPGSSFEPPAACLWELSRGESGTLEVKLQGEEDEVSSVAISPDGSRLVTGRVDKTARIWDLSASQPAKSFVELTGFEDKVSALTVGPRGRWLMTGGHNQPVRLWDLSAEEVSAAVELGKTRCFDVAVSPDGRWAAAAAAEEIVLWNLTGAPPGSQQVVLRGCRGANSFSSRWKSFSAQCKTVFSANGRWLAAPGEEDTARVWDLSASAPAASELVLRCHTGDFKQIAMSRDERWLAVAAGANVLLWDLTARHPQDSAAFVEVDASVIDFTPDSRWLITGNSLATTAWDLNMSALVEAAHQQAGRSLTDSERQEFIFD